MHLLPRLYYCAIVSFEPCWCEETGNRTPSCKSMVICDVVNEVDCIRCSGVLAVLGSMVVSQYDLREIQ